MSTAPHASRPRDRSPPPLATGDEVIRGREPACSASHDESDERATRCAPKPQEGTSFIHAREAGHIFATARRSYFLCVKRLD